MRCPYCRHADSRVIDSREVDEGQAIRRRRSCTACAKRFTTVETAVVSVIKRSGVTEPFDRTKVIDGVRRACQGRPVDEDALAVLAQQVEDAVRATGCAEIPSQEVGLAILGPLKDLDEVAYLRFASVYRAYTSADDFLAEILALRDGQPTVAVPSQSGAARAVDTRAADHRHGDAAAGTASGGAAPGRAASDGAASDPPVSGHPPRPPVGVG